MESTCDAAVLGPETARIVEAAISSRRSVRAFRPDPVPRDLVHPAGGEGHDGRYPYYPGPLFEPYPSRRRKIGRDLYGLIGVRRGETAPENRLRTERAALHEFAGCSGF
jgi:hypothetical protein